MKYPIPNKRNFFANSVGGNIKIIHHSLFQIFVTSVGKLKIFILPNLISFDGIVGNDSLKQLNAVIYIKEDYMTIDPNIIIPLKQHVSEPVNKFNINTEHLNKEHRDRLMVCLSDDFLPYN